LLLEPAEIAATIADDGFDRRNSDVIEPALAARGMVDFEGFADSWNDLGMDLFMADGGRYRRRRHVVFNRSALGLERQPHRAHFQSRDYNSLNGGVARWFDPVKDDIAAHPALLAVIDLGYEIFNAVAPRPLWEIELHQFRITAAPGEEGRPTPEGMHRDGVDYVMVMLIKRENIESGVTSIADCNGASLGSFTLAQPMDATFVDDRRAFHGVTPIVPIDPALPAWRDVLVATFRGR
jgi:hypothetical protein